MVVQAQVIVRDAINFEHTQGFDFCSASRQSGGYAFAFEVSHSVDPEAFERHDVHVCRHRSQQGPHRNLVR